MVSHCYPPAKGRFPRVTHPSATKVSVSKLTDTPVRLACIRHAASVSPEPGSNSPKKVLFPDTAKIDIRRFIYNAINCLLADPKSLFGLHSYFVQFSRFVAQVLIIKPKLIDVNWYLLFPRANRINNTILATASQQ